MHVLMLVHRACFSLSLSLSLLFRFLSYSQFSSWDPAQRKKKKGDRNCNGLSPIISHPMWIADRSVSSLKNISSQITDPQNREKREMGRGLRMQRKRYPRHRHVPFLDSRRELMCGHPWPTVLNKRIPQRSILPAQIATSNLVVRFGNEPS